MTPPPRQLSLPLAVLAAVLGAFTGLAGAQCSDPGLQAARGAYRNCASSATGAFQDELDGCLERDRTCVDACRTEQQDCRDGTKLGADLAACRLELEASKERCRDRFRVGSNRREACIDRAQAAGFRCRRHAARGARRALRDCRSSFTQCASACAPGGPPEGLAACREEARSVHQAALLECRTTFQVTVSGRVNRDVTCVQGCGDAREVCNAPTRTILDDAIAGCKAQRNADVAACRAANPGGGSALEECIEAAQADAFTCRAAALDAAAPGFGACTAANVGCIRACPPAERTSDRAMP